MAHYISSYHTKRKKQWIIRISAAVGILLLISLGVWAISGSGHDSAKLVDEKSAVPDAANDKTTLQQTKPVAAEQQVTKKLEPVPVRAEIPVRTEAPVPARVEATVAAPIPVPVVEKPLPKPTNIVDPTVGELIRQAFLLANTKPIEARDMLNNILVQTPMSPQQTLEIKNKLAELSQYWLFSRKVFDNDPLCGTYTVKPGDMLSKIGKKFNVPYEILMQVNNIQNAASLMAGQKIKVINGPFNAKVYRSTFTVDVYLQKTYVRSFKAGLGKPGEETPTGYWVVKDGGKLIQPPWYDKKINKVYKSDDPDYPLGTRWIELYGLEGDAVGRTGIAFHGTNDDSSIGTMCSRGCVRMHNPDVELLYKLLEPSVSNVRITD